MTAHKEEAGRNFTNRTLYRGDNLLMLRGLNSETVDLIATDPPFNKGRDFHATPDSLSAGAKFQDRWSWKRDVQPEWVDAIEDDWPGVAAVINAAKIASGEDMAAFLCFLGVRLIEMRRVLKETGSIYLHADDTAAAWIRALMDGVFGRAQFRNAIVWCYTGPGNAKRWFPRKHDTILFYSKSADWTFNWRDVRIPYVKTETGRTSGIFKKAATLDAAGKVPESWWTNFSPVGRIASERIGYPTQKPLALYERIIRASSNEGDMVLDPFCGCATTPVAAEKLGRQWIGMDLWKQAHAVITKRIREEALPEDFADADGSIVQLCDEDNGKIPVRTDNREPAVPYLPTTLQSLRQPWQRLTVSQIKDRLFAAQSAPGSPTRAICAGCGDPHRKGNLEVDHREPRKSQGVDWITNRVLLCSACNKTKSYRYTLDGLRDYLAQTREIVNREAAESADAAARNKAQEIKETMAKQARLLTPS